MFRQIVDAMPQLVWLMRADGSTEYVNHRWREYTGLTWEDAAAGRWITAVHPDDAAGATADWQRALATGEGYEHEHRLRRASDGQYRWFIGRAQPLRDASGNLVRWLGTSTDIHDRKQAEEALRASENRYRATFDAAPVGIAHLSLGGKWLLFNDQLCRITGYAREELSQLSLPDITHPADVDPDWTEARRLLAGTATSYTLEKRYIRKDGSVVWVNLMGSLVRNEAGVPLHFIAVIEDISARKRTEQLLAAARGQLEAVINAMADGLVVFDMAGNVVLVNEAEARITGYESPEAMMVDVPYFAANFELRALDGRVLPVEEWPVSRVLRGETLVDVELAVRRLDAGLAWRIVFSGGPVFGADGKQELGVTISRDATGRALAEEALRESEQRFRDLANNITQLAWTADETGAVFWYNQRWFDYTGTTFDEMRGWGWQKVHHPEHLGRVLDKFKDHVARGEVWEDTFPLRSKDGEWHWFLSRAVPIRDDAGRVLRWFGTNTDVTELREAEAALREADRRKTEFLAALSHELRNPLAPIRNAVHILDRAVPGGDQAMRAQAILARQVDQLARLIDDLLDVTRIARGKVRLARERIDLGAVLHRTAEDHEAEFARAGVALQVDLGDAAPGEPDHVFTHGDAVRLSQVVGNLLGNAAKFTPRGGHTWLSLGRAPGQPDRAVISVRDDGAGMAGETLASVFEPFVQAEMTLDRSRGGLGLGLALVKGLTELHGGTVRALSDGLGRGSEFVIELPADPPAAPTPARAASPAAAAPHRALNVLLIEDNRDAAESLGALLELGGHHVTIANNGRAGLEMAHALRPDLVLCDIGLPGMDGYEVARAMRADETLRSTFLVALSGYALPEDVERARQAGFAMHLAKPPDLARLEQLLARQF